MYTRRTKIHREKYLNDKSEGEVLNKSWGRPLSNLGGYRGNVSSK